MVARGARPRRSWPGISLTAGKPCAMITAGQRAVISPGGSGPPGGYRSRWRTAARSADRCHVPGGRSTVWLSLPGVIETGWPGSSGRIRAAGPGRFDQHVQRGAQVGVRVDDVGAGPE